MVIFHELAHGDDASRRKHIHLHYVHGVSPNAKEDTLELVSNDIEPDPLSTELVKIGKIQVVRSGKIDQILICDA